MTQSTPNQKHNPQEPSESGPSLHLRYPEPTAEEIDEAVASGNPWALVPELKAQWEAQLQASMTPLEWEYYREAMKAVAQAIESESIDLLMSQSEQDRT